MFAGSMITFKAPKWIKHDKEQLVDRIAAIVTFDQIHLPEEIEDDVWQLDSSSNWLLHIKEDECELTYRYHSTYKPKQWEALKTVIDMFVG